MMIEQFWTFLPAITLLTVLPGVDSLLVVRNSARGGWEDGLATSAGICSGLFVHALVSALGVSTLLLHSAFAFNLLKLIGGGYLLWLGICSLLQAVKGNGHGEIYPLAAGSGFYWRRSFREGFVCNVFNPKALLFYMAFLPQFINPAGSPLLQSLFMAAVHFCIAMVYQGALSFFAARVKRIFQGGRLRPLSEGLIGLLLISLGIRIFMGERGSL